MAVPRLARQPVRVAVILAGGQARRMGGGDKCLLPVGGVPILARILAVLRPQVTTVAISANGPAERFAAYGCPVLPDPPDYPGAGPLAGLAASFQAFPGCPLATIPGDLPFLPEDLVARLAAAAGPAGSAHARSLGRDHPALAFHAATAAGPLEAHLAAGGRSVRGFLSERRSVAVEWGPAADGGDPFENVNDATDLMAARRRAG